MLGATGTAFRGGITEICKRHCFVETVLLVRLIFRSRDIRTLYVSPRISKQYVVNGITTYVEFMTHSQWCKSMYFTKFPYLSYLLFSEFYVVVLFSTSASANAPALLIHIIHIVLMRSGVKVERVATSSGGNAGMKNLRLVRWRERLVVNYPRDPMRRFKDRHSIDFGYKRLPIATRTLFRKHPRPAFFSTLDFNLGPKPFLELFGEGLRKNERTNSFVSHSSQFVDCLPRSRSGMTRGQLLFTP